MTYTRNDEKRLSVSFGRNSKKVEQQNASATRMENLEAKKKKHNDWVLHSLHCKWC